MPTAVSTMTTMTTMTTKREVIIMVGYPGSGKSTWANAQEGYIRIDGDSLKTPKAMVRAAEKCMVKDPTKSIIFDSTGSTKKRRSEFIAFANRHELPVKIMWIQTSMEESMKRNSLRLKPIPSIVYYVYRKIFETPTEIEGCQLVPQN